MNQAESNQWLADYKSARRAAEAIAEAERGSRIGGLPITLTGLAYAEGAIPTKAAAKGPRPLFAKLDTCKPVRFEKRYPEPFKDTDPCVADTMTKRRRRKIDSRVYGSWSDLPPEIRYHFTEKERAALHVIAKQVLTLGRCDKSVKEIADLAGAGISTVKSAIKEAKALGLIRVQSRPRKGLNHLPSIITIVSTKWRKWLQTLVANKSTTIKNSKVKQERKTPVEPSQGAFERERAAGSRPISIAEYAVADAVSVTSRLGEVRRGICIADRRQIGRTQPGRRD
jgi:hypothetical protein